MIVSFNKYIFKWAIVVVILMLMVGCGGVTSFEDNENENTTSIDEVKNNNVSEKNDINDIKEINLYFGNENAYLAVEVREIEEPTPKKVIQEIIKGPLTPNLRRTMPEEIEIIDVEVKGNIAYANFTKTFEEAFNGNYGTSAASSLLIYSIVNTLTLCDEFEIDKVQFLVEGNNQVSLGPYGIVDIFSTDIDVMESGNIVIMFYDFGADDYENPVNLKEFSISINKYKNNKAEVLNDIFSQIGITINNITSKENGKYIVVDITKDTVNNFERGSTAGIILTNEFIMTLLNLPDVEKVEVTVDGKSGSEGNHYSFNGIFVKDKDYYKLIH